MPEPVCKISISAQPQMKTGRSVCHHLGSGKVSHCEGTASDVARGLQLRAPTTECWWHVTATPLDF